MSLDKRRAAVAVLGAATLLLGLTTQPWASGTAADVLSAGTTEVTGGEAAPGVVGLALVAAAALLGLMTGGRVGRLVARIALVLSSLGALLLVALAVLRPGEVVAAQVARDLARTTAPQASGSTTVLGWLALGASLALLVVAVLAVISSRSWSALSDRYERSRRPEAGPRGEVRSPWDELSDGADPTLREDPTAN